MGFDSGSCSLAGWVKKTFLLYFVYALLYHKVVNRIPFVSLILASDLVSMETKKVISFLLRNSYKIIFSNYLSQFYIIYHLLSKKWSPSYLQVTSPPLISQQCGHAWPLSKACLFTQCPPTCMYDM